MKKVEFLYPELCNIYAESYNIEYLSRCCEELEIINTRHGEVPAFAQGDVDMIYLGCLTERKQEKVIELLRPYTERIKELIDKGTIFLVTGNAIEIFGKSIEDAGRIIPALGIFDFTAKRYMDVERHNSQYVGMFRDGDGEEILLLGHRSQFSFAYGDFEKTKFVDIEIGIGMNPDTKAEGIHVNNFFGTYSLGPYFIMNPLFAKYILRKLGVDDTLLFEKEAVEAYEYRRDELRRNLG
ncbi:MAG: hypothetical protein PUC20_05635 [Firmicutes bacterium]|nr:hypothetical protein [Bacillota bacterium]